jgi:sugar phosphate isomerase/epimerase
MKISFMTLGCPQWDLDTLIQRGRAYGFDGVDFRGLLEDVDVTKRPEFTSGLQETKRKLADAALAVSAISSSISLCDPNKRVANLDEARRTIPIARELGAGVVRVFGNGPVKEIGHLEAAKIGLDCLREILDLDGARQLVWVFETHDHWIRSADCNLLLKEIADPAFGALWDLCHTARVGKETPEQTYAAIGSRVRYTHVKDAKLEPGHPASMPDGWRYVAPGTGDLPVEQAVRLLVEKGYDGWFQFEHEKRWQPKLAEPEEVFPHFVAWIRGLGL